MTVSHDLHSAHTCLPVPLGEVFVGKFRLERIVGIGGMGMVVEAIHLKLNQRVAIKFLLPELAKNSQSVQRFITEARAAAKIKSEFVARTTDVETLENGMPYIVMEFLDGIDLGERLCQEGILSINQSVCFVLQACVALAEAHSYGIIHRDLKPQNLFISVLPDGTELVKVLDFGISKTIDVSNTSVEGSYTKDGMFLLGTPYYMSPEQIKSPFNVDRRSDIWALGVTLFQMISGEFPFVGTTLSELVRCILREPPQSLFDFVQDLPEGLEPVIRRCLAKKPEDRYCNVVEFSEVLAQFGAPNHLNLFKRVAAVSGVPYQPSRASEQISSNSDIEKEASSSQPLFSPSVHDTPVRPVNFHISIDHEQWNQIQDTTVQSLVQVRAGMRTGTGFLLSRKGHVLTAAYVVGKETEMTVRMRNGESRTATVLNADPIKDIALLQLIGPCDLNQICIANHENIQNNQSVAALARTAKSDLISFGVIGERAHIRNNIAYLQTNVLIFPQYIGGPVIDESGSLVGMVSWLGSRTTSGFGLCLSLPHIMAILSRFRVPFKRGI